MSGAVLALKAQDSPPQVIPASVGRGVRLAAAFAVLSLILGPAALAQPIANGAPGQWNAAPCHGHGHTDFGRCFCDPGWAGAQCDAPEKPLNCGEHGKASHGWCVCEPGWSGAVCDKGS
jgi:EGF-like domain